MSAVIRPATLGAWQRTLPALALLLVAALLMYRDTALAMVAIWLRSETFAHAFIVPLISLWLVWQRRDALAAQVPRPTAWGLLPLAAAGLLWLLGELAAVNAATQLALVAIVVFAVVTLIGLQASRTIAFALGFLFFAVPIGEFLLPRLMLWTADFTVLALRLTGVPVYRDGQQMVIPSGTWSVVEACSGIRYLIASLMVGVLFAHLSFRSWRRRLAFVAASVAVPLVANWVRAYMIVMIAHLSGNRLAVGIDHLIYGWVFFGVVISLLFLIGARWSEPARAEAPAAGTLPGAIGVAPSAWLLAALAALLLAVPHWLAARAEQGLAGAPPVLEAPERLGAQWRPADAPVADFRPQFQAPSAEIDRSYVGPAGDKVGLYIAYYRGQDYEHKLVSSANVLAGGDGPWLLTSSGSRTLDVAGRPLAVAVSQLRYGRNPAPDAERLVAWQLYWVNGRLTASDARAKLYGAWDRLLGRGDDAAAIVVYTHADGEAGEARLEALLGRHLGELQALLQKTRDRDRATRDK